LEIVKESPGISLDSRIQIFRALKFSLFLIIFSIEREIDELLIELDGITERMGAYADQPAVRNNATVTHTLTRHRDILQG
jgi:hypothetical protein